jgi:hypothetical protein
LRQAIQSWHHAPKAAPSTDLADRILAAVADENARLIPFRNRRLWQRGWTIGLAATAAAALAIVIYPRHDRSRPLPNAPGPERSIARIEPETNPKPKPTTPAEVDLPALNQALTDASDATWDLAYAASGPAVRLGRQVFDRPAGSGPSRSPDEPGPSSRPGIFPAEAPGEVVSDALSRFGKEISEGVRPLSDSALRAINFLQRAVPSPVPAIETPPPMSDSKGA